MSPLRWTIVLATALLFLGCGPSEPKQQNRDLLGAWEADAELTRELPQNQSFDPDKLRSAAQVFATIMKVQQTFSPDGRSTIKLHNGSTDFTYSVVKRDGDQLTLQCQIVADPKLRKYAEGDTFEPFECEWLIVGRDRIAKRLTGESDRFWIVYRRVAETHSTSVNEPDTDDWEALKREALACPPIEWSCTETDSFRQRDDFHRWYFKTPLLVPEVYPTVNDWLDSRETTINTIITNKPTGAQFRITGTKQTEAVRCSVEFIGNLNWK